MALLTYEAYGLAIATAFELAALRPVPDRDPDVTFEVTPAPLPETGARQRLYASPHPDAHGAPSVALDRHEGTEVLVFGGTAAFELRRRHITCYLADESYRAAVEIWLLGTVMAYWMERAGLIALHAGSVIVDGRAIGFVGTNGSGKSTLVADLVQGGYPLLTDDILPLERRDGAWRGRPGYAQMRMWPEQALRLLGGYDTLRPVLPWGEKRRVPVGAGGFGTFHDRTMPLGALYVPVREIAPERSEISIEPVPSHEALATLLEQAFVAPLMAVAPFRAERFSRLADLTMRVPVRRLQYPNGYEHLPRVREALLADMNDLPGCERASAEPSSSERPDPPSTPVAPPPATGGMRRGS